MLDDLQIWVREAPSANELAFECRYLSHISVDSVEQVCFVYFI